VKVWGVRTFSILESTSSQTFSIEKYSHVQGRLYTCLSTVVDNMDMLKITVGYKWFFVFWKGDIHPLLRRVEQ